MSQKCLKCQLEKELVERADYCETCYDELRQKVHRAADRTREQKNQYNENEVYLEFHPIVLDEETYSPDPAACIACGFTEETGADRILDLNIINAVYPLPDKIRLCAGCRQELKTAIDEVDQRGGAEGDGSREATIGGE